MHSANKRARSSMAEQWPFKPLVEGSSPPALTKLAPKWRKTYPKRGVFLPPRPANRQVFAFNVPLWGQAVNLKNDRL